MMEAMGYPRRGSDWLRRKRGWVIVVLAVFAWIAVVGFGFGLIQLGREVLDLLVP